MSISKLTVSRPVSLILLLIPISAVFLISPINTFGLIKEANAQDRKQEIAGTLTINSAAKEPLEIVIFKGDTDCQPYRQQLSVTSNNGTTVTFPQIPMGDYTVAINRAGKYRKTSVTAAAYTTTEERVYGPAWKKGQFHMNSADMTVVLTNTK
ncbi:hypothetical protein BH11CYA1_BH11CYA1_47300 [soil metagenome]